MAISDYLTEESLQNLLNQQLADNQGVVSLLPSNVSPFFRMDATSGVVPRLALEPLYPNFGAPLTNDSSLTPVLKSDIPTIMNPGASQSLGFDIPFGALGSEDNFQGFTDKVDFSKPQEPTGIAKLASYLPLGENSMAGSIIRSLIPKADPAAKFMNDFYRNRFGLTDIGQVASGIMKGYNPVSGGLINRITKGKYGDPMKIGLQGAYQKRIDRIKKTLQDKYLSKGRSLDETELDERLALLEQLKLDELNAFKQFVESKSPQSKGLGDIGSAGIDETIQTGGAAEDKPGNAFAPLKDTFSGGKVKDVKSVPGGKYGSPK
jgi:hypothetical protein